MKQILPYSLLLLLFTLLSINEASAQSLTPKKFIIQPYIGGPNMKNWAYNSVLLGQTEYNSSITSSSVGYAHYGLNAEFLISERIGIGFDGIYSPFKRTLLHETSGIDPISGKLINITNKEVFTEDKLRIIAKVFIHFNVENPQWDLYISGGIGTNLLFTEYRYNGEKQNYEANVGGSGKFPLIRPAFPISGRFCFGARYFFSENFGIHFETGFGGPPFSFGLSIGL